MEHKKIDGYLLTSDITAMFDVTLRCVYMWIEKGKLHPIRAGRTYLFDPADVARFKAERREQQKRNWGGKRKRGKDK